MYLGVGMDNDLVTRNDGGDNGAAKLRACSIHVRIHGIKNFYQQGGSPGQSVQCPAAWMESGLQVKSQNRSWRDADRFYARFLGISDDCKESAKRQSKECLPEHRWESAFSKIVARRELRIRVGSRQLQSGREAPIGHA